VILDGLRERQGDYVLTANHVGEYAFCFENDMSTLTAKLVDFDIMVESEPRREAPAKPGKVSDHTSALEESIFRLNGMLMNIKRMQKQSVLASFSCLCFHLFVVGLVTLIGTYMVTTGSTRAKTEDSQLSSRHKSQSINIFHSFAPSLSMR